MEFSLKKTHDNTFIVILTLQFNSLSQNLLSDEKRISFSLSYA
jgi:hypothetical protein